MIGPIGAVALLLALLIMLPSLPMVLSGEVTLVQAAIRFGVALTVCGGGISLLVWLVRTYAVAGERARRRATLEARAEDSSATAERSGEESITAGTPRRRRDDPP